MSRNAWERALFCPKHGEFVITELNDPDREAQLKCGMCASAIGWRANSIAEFFRKWFIARKTANQLSLFPSERSWS